MNPLWMRTWSGAQELRDPTKDRRELAETRARRLAHRIEQRMASIFGKASRQHTVVSVRGFEVKALSNRDDVFDVHAWFADAPPDTGRAVARLRKFDRYDDTTYRAEDVPVTMPSWVFDGLMRTYEFVLTQHPEVLEGGTDAAAKDHANRNRRGRSRDAIHARWQSRRNDQGRNERPTSGAERGVDGRADDIP